MTLNPDTLPGVFTVWLWEQGRHTHEISDVHIIAQSTFSLFRDSRTLLNAEFADDPQSKYKHYHRVTMPHIHSGVYARAFSESGNPGQKALPHTRHDRRPRRRGSGPLEAGRRTAEAPARSRTAASHDGATHRSRRTFRPVRQVVPECNQPLMNHVCVYTAAEFRATCMMVKIWLLVRRQRTTNRRKNQDVH